MRRFGNFAIVVCSFQFSLLFFEERFRPAGGCIPGTAATGGVPSARTGSVTSLSLIFLFEAIPLLTPCYVLHSLFQLNSSLQ